MLQVQIAGLDSFIEQRVREAVAKALGSKPDEDPWLDSKAAAAHAGVSVQRIHDAVCSGDITRHGEKGTRLYFRRSQIDAWRAGVGGSSPERGIPARVQAKENVTDKANAPAALQGSGAGHEE